MLAGGFSYVQDRCCLMPVVWLSQDSVDFFHEVWYHVMIIPEGRFP